MFKFSLQQVADALEHETAQQAGVLRALNERLDAGLEAVGAASREIERTRGLQQERLAPGRQFSVDALRDLRAYAGERRQELQAREETAAALENECAQQRERVQEGVAAQKAVQQVRERRLREHQAEQLRLAEKESDALWLACRGHDTEENENG